MDYAVELKGISKIYGKQTVLSDFDLSIRAGELMVLLGPSGCGKTTTLRLIAGLEAANSGTVHIDGKDVTNIPLRKRNVGMVFQAYSLFPHMNALENVAYGLRVQKVAKAARLDRARDMLALVGLLDSAEKYPAQLSGGQQQRVALARALLLEPKVLLLDEPLSALDAKVRVRLREEIRTIHDRAGITTVMVSHDQEEALSMADRIAVMSEGEILQLDDPMSIYNMPKARFVSEFIGSVNRIRGTRTGDTVDVLGHMLPVINKDSAFRGEVTAFVRPELFQIDPDGEPNATVEHMLLIGPTTIMQIRADGYPELVRCDVSTSEAVRMHEGMRVNVTVAHRPVLVDEA